MRNLSNIIVFLCLLLLIPPLSVVYAIQDSWETLAPSPITHFIGSAEIDEKIYLVGSNVNSKYDPETNTWTPLTPPPISNSWSDVVVCQNKIYLIGGNASKPTQVYDPISDTWENRTSIPTTRSALEANVVDNKIYVIGGQMLAGLYIINPSSANDVYDPATDSWSKMASIPVPVMGYASTVLDGKIYIISGGNTGGPDYEPTNLVQIFDPKTNQWTNGTNIPTGVVSAKACSTTGLFALKRIYVLGGTVTSYARWAAYNVINLIQIYDPESDIWTNGLAMPSSRFFYGAICLNDEIYVIGGINGENYLDVNEKYTPLDYIPEFPSLTLLVAGFFVISVISIFYRRHFNPRRRK